MINNPFYPFIKSLGAWVPACGLAPLDSLLNNCSGLNDE